MGVFLSQNASVKSLTKDGYSPLYYAAQNGHEAVVGLLLANGSDPNIGSLNLKVSSDRMAKTYRIRWMLGHPELWVLFYGVDSENLFQWLGDLDDLMDLLCDGSSLTLSASQRKGGQLGDLPGLKLSDSRKRPERTTAPATQDPLPKKRRVK